MEWWDGIKKNYGKSAVSIFICFETQLLEIENMKFCYNVACYLFCCFLLDNENTKYFIFKDYYFLGTLIVPKNTLLILQDTTQLLEGICSSVGELFYSHTGYCKPY